MLEWNFGQIALMKNSDYNADSKRRLTQKDLAQKLGLAQSTVSMALRRHPNLPAQTIARVHRLAQQIGYQPDPYLAGLAAYRKQLHPSRYKATVAWLSHQFKEMPSWQESRIFRAYHRGACERAEALGYRVEEHVLGMNSGNSASRLKKILRARNIEGILLPPQPGLNASIDFDFSRFSVVTFGYTLQQPKLNLVSHQHFHSARLAMLELQKLGYRRIGLAMPKESDTRTLYGWTSGVRSIQTDLPAAEQVRPLLCQEYSDAEVIPWLKNEQPDVIVASGTDIYERLLQARVRVPEEIGFAALNAWDEAPWISGIDQNPELTGARALELLVEKLNLREVGVPAIVTQTLVQGTWLPGKTVCSRARRKAGTALARLLRS